MITSIILLIFSGLLLVFVNLLPAGTALPTGISDAISTIVPYWNQWASIFPLDTALTLVSLTVILEGSIWIFGLSDWTYKKIRG